MSSQIKCWNVDNNKLNDCSSFNLVLWNCWLGRQTDDICDWVQYFKLNSITNVIFLNSITNVVQSDGSRAQVQSRGDGHRSLVTPERVLSEYNKDMIFFWYYYVRTMRYCKVNIFLVFKSNSLSIYLH